MKLRNVKDKTPNQELINQLERLLNSARNGDLRSIFTICSWDNDGVTHGWAYDHRSSRRRILAEMVLLQHDYITDTEFAENDSILAQRFQEWE